MLLSLELLHRLAMRLARRSVFLMELAAHVRWPARVFWTLLAIRTLATSSLAKESTESGLLHFLGIALIGSGAWLVAAILLAMEDAAEERFRLDVPDNRQARRIRTQVAMLRRVTIALVVVLATGLILMTFPQVRAIGASVLASAGVIGIVAALAAQSVLGNVIAGVQLAFSDAIRIDDVVVIENEWARVEELTLTYVVLHIWDDRRLILPTSYFISKPFQNWTRTQSKVLGTVEFDLDWHAPVQQMRDELRKLVTASELWDERVCVLQVTDAVGGMVRVRALVSASDAPSLWDLRCLVREHLVLWIRDHRPVAIPRTRTELTQSPSPATRPARAVLEQDNARVFSGSADAELRGDAFHGPDVR